MPLSAVNNFRRNTLHQLEARQLSQNEFAQISGVPQSTLQRLLAPGSTATPSLSTVESIARGFGIDIADLVGSVGRVPVALTTQGVVAKQIGRLVEDFLSSNERARITILRTAEAAACGDTGPYQ